MSAWRQRVDDLLFDGETVEAEVDVGTAHVAVTSHRVLAFTPTADGENFRQVDRPNVAGVERRGVDRIDVRERAIKAALVGFVAVTLGAGFDPTTFVTRPDLSSVQDTGGVGGVGAVLGMAQGLLDVFFALDDAMLVGGALLLLVGAAMFGAQLALRQPRLAIDVAGGDPILLPEPADDSAVDRLRAAVAPPTEPTDGERDAVRDASSDAPVRESSVDAPSEPGDTVGTDGARLEPEE